MNQPRGIEIVGGGLAGLSLGLALRRAGIKVAIFEAAGYPRHRVCGEFITGLSAATISRLGLAPILADALHHREVAWFIGEKPSGIQRLPAPALGLSRFALDARLADAFVRAGGDLHTHERVTALDDRPGRVFAQGRRRARSPWIGLKFHVRHLALDRDLELHLGDHAYAGLSRVEAGAINVCGLFRNCRAGSPDPADSTAVPRRGRATPPYTLLLDHLRTSGLSPLADRLAAAEIDDRSFSAVAALAFDHTPLAARGIALGDACAMIPPFTGNGMAMAFQSAEAALEPLLAYARDETSWSAACRVTRSALRRRFRTRLASAGMLHPFLLRPPHQRWFAALNRARLLPFRPLYAALH
ncbi:MAG TPA: FAD-dependent monooxygenase [Opitutus sp.]|nr:FAD-dependent monooxygenase [Opitutus sp.]